MYHKNTSFGIKWGAGIEADYPPSAELWAVSVFPAEIKGRGGGRVKVFFGEQHATVRLRVWKRSGSEIIGSLEAAQKRGYNNFKP